jgi:hypothetical protein
MAHPTGSTNKKRPIPKDGALYSSKSVSRVLFRCEAISIINLALPLPTGSINLPILTTA